MTPIEQLILKYSVELDTAAEQLNQQGEQAVELTIYGLLSTAEGRPENFRAAVLLFNLALGMQAASAKGVDLGELQAEVITLLERSEA
ncbi:hypothetical protein DKM44_02205 [Deinococcus irradiatisoli]|uniref:Uncharacterized protein n=1 Tax=Deinococcus irradiatisoli TaxID=2202254 RepID=A0A2Z3JB12_9DEIO|nr:hypothetical protein [Deinococcus irradiatisoli]AWN22192.1 hypothetical protein DKM44_02205 [Deinococcus irradiatisoli]